MKKTDFDSYSKRIDKYAKLVSSYLEDDYYYKLIKVCRLKPYEKIKVNSKLKLINHWVDEFGNSLLIDKKNVSILIGDIKLFQDIKIKTDIMFNMSIEEVKNNSRALYFGVAEHYYELCFRGADNYLRSYMAFDNELQVISSLLFDRKIIEEILDFKDDKKIITQNILGIENSDHYLTKLPSSLKLVDEMVGKLTAMENII